MVVDLDEVACVEEVRALFGLKGDGVAGGGWEFGVAPVRGALGGGGVVAFGGGAEEPSGVGGVMEELGGFEAESLEGFSGDVGEAVGVEDGLIVGVVTAAHAGAAVPG